MQIVIEIDEDTYRYMQSRCKYQNKCDKGLSKFEGAGVAIKNGTPLPKEHGRLIDADELEECKEIMTTISGESKYAVRIDDIRNMSTIIEADAESEAQNEKRIN